MRPDDYGFSLLETMVTMAVMSVVTAIFATGVMQIYSSSNATESLTVASTQLHNAFVRLDRGIRFATGVSRQNTDKNYVEYENASSGITTCTQIRIISGQLQTRQKIGAGAVSGWSVLASSVTSGTLERQNAEPTNPYQRLVVTIVLSAGTGDAFRRSGGSFAYTALNTSQATSSDTVCGTLGRP